MLKEKYMFDEVYAFLEKHYNQTDFDEITKEFAELSNKYKGSGLWQNLILCVLDHLEAKAKWEKSRNEAKSG